MLCKGKCLYYKLIASIKLCYSNSTKTKTECNSIQFNVIDNLAEDKITFYKFNTIKLTHLKLILFNSKFDLSKCTWSFKV